MIVAPRLAAAVLAVGVIVAGCGGNGAEKNTTPTPGTSISSTPSPTASLAPGTPTGSPRPGLPTDFPGSDVPLLDGTVSTQYGGAVQGEEGRKGWVLEVKVAKTAKACFDDAAAVLVEHGYTKQGEITARDTEQAQFTKPGYAVVISARSDGTGGCILGYEVGQVAQ